MVGGGMAARPLEADEKTIKNLIGGFKPFLFSIIYLGKL
jgi:hypothetical protein